MSSISSVASATHLNPAANPGGVGQLVQDFKAIGGALQAGDLPNAQSALATFQQELQKASQTSATQPFGKNLQANTDFQSLTSDLRTGDLAGAQQAFSSLQNDLKSAQSAPAAQPVHPHQPAFATGASSTTAAAANNLGNLNLVA